MAPENQIINDLRCDYLLLVATSTEFEELEKVAEEKGKTFDGVKGKHTKYYDLGKFGHSRVMAIRTRMGPFSYGGSASTAIYSLIETQAQSLICLGMGFGVDQKTQKIGDVLVSRVLLPYDNRIVQVRDGQMHVDYKDVVPHKANLSLVRILEKQSEKNGWIGKVQFGALLTGAARIRCKEYRDELIAGCPNANEPVIGGEMEGVGLLSSCDPKFPSWIIAKGICDFADEVQEADVKQYRPIACRSSAQFVIEALENFESQKTKPGENVSPNGGA